MINQVNIKFSLPENQPKQNQQQPQLQQSYTIDNYNRLSQELRNRYMGQKDELASQQFQAFPSKPTNLPVSEPNHRQSSPSFPPNKQNTALPRRLLNNNGSSENIQSRYTNRLKSSSLGPSSSHENEQFYAGFGSVKNLVESYEGIPYKEQIDSESKLNQIRMQRQKEITDAIILTKQSYGIQKGLNRFFGRK